jgi:hypothetical protein
MTTTTIKSNEFERIGVYLDHASASAIGFHNNDFTTHNIVSKFTHAQKIHSLGKSENLMHHQEQHEQAEYYHEIAAIIKPYKEIVLFGPTTAKEELHNVLVADHAFAKTEIKVKQTDKLSVHEQQGFIRDYFSKHL